MYYLDVIVSLIVGIVIMITIYSIISIFLIQKYTYRGPNSGQVKSQIFNDNETKKCYKFVPKIYLCPDNFKHS